MLGSACEIYPYTCFNQDLDITDTNPERGDQLANHVLMVNERLSGKYMYFISQARQGNCPGGSCKLMIGPVSAVLQ